MLSAPYFYDPKWDVRKRLDISAIEEIPKRSLKNHLADFRREVYPKLRRMCHG